MMGFSRRDGNTRVRQQQGRRWLAGTASAVLVAGLGLVMVRADGFAAARVALESGQAWVASSTVGQIALIDGSTEQKVTAITVSRPGEQISVTQGGPDALVVNRTTGTVLRVKGSTYDDAPGAVTPLAGASLGLSVFAGRGTDAFAVDAARGAAITLDRATMTSRARPVSLAARLSSRATTMDTEGRLWAVDTANGDLVWFDAAGKHTRRGAARPGTGTRLTLVRGEPAIVDPAARQVSLLDPASGDTAASSCLDISADAVVQAGGSSSAALAFAVAPERGVLLVSDLDSGECSRIVTLTRPGAQLGDPVETGGRVFVPDYANGQVFVVDLDADRVVGTPAVLPPGLATFELTPRDGFVFYNDPLSQRSGVIRLDGSVQRISKYNPADPSQQLRRPTRDLPSGQTVTGADAAGSGAGSGGSGTGAAGSGNRGAGKGSGGNGSSARSQDPRKDRQQDPQSQQQPSAPGRQRPTGPASPPPPGQDPGGPVPSSPAQDAALRISSSPPPYRVGSPVTLGVAPSDSTRRLTSATWDLGDGGAAEGTTITHTWAEAAAYPITVRAAFTDGTTGTVSSTLTVQPPDAPPNQAPQAALSLSAATLQVGGSVTADASGSLDPDGSIANYSFDWGDGTQSTSATPGAAHVYDSPCPACQVGLVVTDDKGLTAAASAPIDVQPPPRDNPPTASLTLSSATVEAGQQLSASAAGSSDAEGPVEYRFAWGDGSDTGFTPDVSATHTYTSAGPVTVTLTVRDSAGQEATATAPLTVTTPPRDDPPVAALSVSPGSGSVNLTVEADATASTDDHDGASLTYVFTWGDGDRSSSSTGRATHTYRSTGSRTVEVTVTDTKGQRDTRSRTVDVNPPTVHKTGTVVLTDAPMWDLDEIENAFMNPAWEVTFGTDDQLGAIAVFDDDGVRVGKVSSAGYDACSGPLPAAPANLQINVGDVLCITTDQGRLSMVEILNNAGQGRITTWDAPN
jgi:PKD repeat protein